MLWHCWLGIRKSIRPVKKLSDEVLEWFYVWSEMQMICIWSSCASLKSITVFTFLVPAYRGCPGKEAIKRVSSFCFSFCLLKTTMRILIKCRLHTYLPTMSSCALLTTKSASPWCWEEGEDSRRGKGDEGNVSLLQPLPLMCSVFIQSSQSQ